MQSKPGYFWTKFKQSTLLLLMGFSLTLTLQNSWARAPEEAELSAAENLGDEIASWITHLDKAPESVALYTTHVNEPFEANYATLVDNGILTALVQRGISKATTCPQCRTAQVEVKDDQVIISKGTPDMESIKAAGRKLPVASFLVVEIYRTAFAVIAQATLYANETGEVIAAQHFRVPALNFADSSVQVLITLGSGKQLYSTGTPPSGLTTSAHLALLEELGFGKGGLALGTIIAPKATLIYLDPTISFRGRFGSYGLGWSLNLGGGYGFLSDLRGITARGSFEFFVGSLAVMGVEGTYFFPSNPGGSYLTGFVGFHIGIAFGR